ncbi:MAG: hypothetical protein KA112_02730 [Alphaproteobacteria bacterium]|nr:hypothetical protein [Alphaproteobacteria bacterium]
MAQPGIGRRFDSKGFLPNQPPLSRTFWFLGSVMIGVLYDFSVLAVVIFSVIIQLLAVPILVWVKRMNREMTKKS